MADGAGHRFDIAGLDLLFDRLTSAGFKVGPAGRTRAAALITEFIARDAMPLEAADLARWLQPIFVTRPEERARFMETVVHWAQAAQRVEAPNAPAAAPPMVDPPWRDPEAPARPVRTRLLRRISRRGWIAIAATALIAVLAATPAVQTFVGSLFGRPVSEGASRSSAAREAAPIEPVEIAPPPTLEEEPPEALTGDDVLTRLVTEVTNRAALYGYAPTLEELYTAPAASAADAAPLLPGDAASIGARLGLPIDRPLPLQRADVVTRLLLAMEPEAMRARDEAAQTSDAAVDAVMRAAREGEPVRLLEGRGANSHALAGHIEGVFAAAFSPDGALVVTGSSDRTARVWDALTGAQRRVLRGHESLVVDAIFSRDGERIITASLDGTVRVWSARDGRELGVLAFDGSSIGVVAESIDGQFIAAGAADGSIRVWRSDDFTLVRAIGASASVEALAFGPRGQLAAALLTDAPPSIVEVYNAEGALTATLRGHGPSVTPSREYGLVHAVAFSSDGLDIVTGGADGTARIWNARSGALVRTLSGHAPEILEARFVRYGTRVVTLAVDGARLWDVNSGQLLAAAYTPVRGAGAISQDGEGFVVARGNEARVFRSFGFAVEPIASMQTDALSAGSLGFWARMQLGLPAYPSISRLQDPDLPPGERQDIQRRMAESASDEDIARAWALAAFDMGWPLNISNPPWPLANARPENPLRDWDAPAFFAWIIALGAAALWLWSAIHARGFLARRRPEDTGRIADLASEDRTRSERADQSLRVAARRMLERREGLRQIDLRASVDATARAGGFFTPVSRALRRIPEYLFLIDSRSRFDHDARRALDYVQRLRDENVKVDFYYFERAPDRVREDLGKPLVPIETITSHYASRRLVIVGDAAEMIDADARTVGAWADAIKVWEDRALMTTVPPSEWGAEEAALASGLGLLVRPLSASALAELPGEMRLESEDAQNRVAARHGLSERPLPAALRESAHLWLLESAPPAAQVDRMMTELPAYLGQHGFRWLAACAVYPAIEWDITMALGWRLKEGELGDERALVTETRIALLSELPWLRTGQMPQWLRERLIDEMDPRDRQSVRAFLGELLDAARHGARAPRDAISLTFSVEGGRGRASFDDDVFVQFLLEDPSGRDTRALEATKKVRDLLLPPLWARLLRPAEIAVLVGGLILAVAAFFAAPRFSEAPPPSGAWAPLIALLAAPLMLWGVSRTAPRAWESVAAFARDPLAGWHALQARRAARARLKETDRLAYLRDTAPGVRRTTVALLAILYGAVFTGGLVAPVLWLLGFVAAAPIEGLRPMFESLAAWRAGVRTGIGESAFGWLILAWAAAALAMMGVTVFVSLQGARANADGYARGLPELLAPPDRPRTFRTVAVATIVLAGLVVFGSFVQRAAEPGWALAISGAVLVLLYVAAVVAVRRLRRWSLGIARLRLGLTENLTTLEQEVSVRVPERLGVRLVQQMRKHGVAASLTGVEQQAPGVLVEAASDAGARSPEQRDRVMFDAAAFDAWRGDPSDPAFQALLARVAEKLRLRLQVELATVVQKDIRIRVPRFNLKRRAPAGAEEGADGEFATQATQANVAPYAFVSFASADTARVRPVVAALLERRVSIWIDRPNHPDLRIDPASLARFVQPGGDWSNDAAVASSAAMLTFPSPAARESRSIHLEIQAGVARRMRDERYLVVPLFVDHDSINHLDEATSGYQGYFVETRQTNDGWELTKSGAANADRLALHLRRHFSTWDGDDGRGAQQAASAAPPRRPPDGGKK